MLHNNYTITKWINLIIVFVRTISYLWYGSFFIILKLLYICSNSTSLNNWCGNVNLEKLSSRLDLFNILVESPWDPPIINDIVEYPLIVRLLILYASSSEVNCLPLIAKEII